METINTIDDSIEITIQFGDQNNAQKCSIGSYVLREIKTLYELWDANGRSNLLILSDNILSSVDYYVFLIFIKFIEKYHNIADDVIRLPFKWVDFDFNEKMFRPFFQENYLTLIQNPDVKITRTNDKNDYTFCSIIMNMADYLCIETFLRACGMYIAEEGLNKETLTEEDFAKIIADSPDPKTITQEQRDAHEKEYGWLKTTADVDMRKFQEMVEEQRKNPTIMPDDDDDDDDADEADEADDDDDDDADSNEEEEEEEDADDDNNNNDLNKNDPDN